MALISDATIIIEATENSGTRYQGWEAIKLGRKLFILENSSKLKWVQEMVNYGAIILNRNNYKEEFEEIPIRSFEENIFEWF